MWLGLLLALACLIWVAFALGLAWNARGARILTPSSPLPGSVPGTWPRVSILVPARNEAQALPALLASLAQLDYPDYEIVLVDDASTDSTGAIAEAWAARPEMRGRLRVIHNRELPPGWAGKVHALELAARAATGDWLLAADADVVLHPGALRLGMALALDRGVALLSFSPGFEYSSFWERVVLPAFSLMLFVFFPLRLVNNPRSRRALAAGCFILMRAEDFRSLGGYEPLRATLIEDLRIADHFKRHGRRILLVPTRGLIRTRMYESAGEMFEGLSRSAFEGAGSLWKVAGGILGGFVIAILPWASAVVLATRRMLGDPPAAGHALAWALAACALCALVYLPILIFLRVPPWYVVTLPLAAIFYSAVAVNSTYRSLFGEGVSWKDRRYAHPGKP